MIYIQFLFFSVSFAAYSAMFTLLFHYNKSIFARFKNQWFWNPLLSSGNKYKPGTTIPKFSGSDTVFVFLTDGFHRMQFIFENTLFVGISLNKTNYMIYVYFALLRIVYAIVFNLFFDKILIISTWVKKIK